MLTLAQLQDRLGDDGWHAQQFGPDPRVITEKRQVAGSVLDTFRRSFASPREGPVAACFVPGRVEVLGKHTDYAGGHSLLAAVDRGFFGISTRNGTNRVRLVENDSRFAPCEFELSASLEPALGNWSNYPMTMAKRLVSNFPATFNPGRGGVDIAFGGDLPVAGGLSGSSALMIMTFFALALPNGLPESDLFRANIGNSYDLAMYLACAENGQTFRDLTGSAGVGTFGGSEDHTQILCAKRGMLSLFQFCPTRHKGDIPFPSDLHLIVAYSGVKAEKTGPAMHQYNSVSRRARMAVARFNERCGTSHRLLRDLIDETGDAASLETKMQTVCAGHEEALALRARFLQFFQEDRELIPRAVQAFRAGDCLALGEVIDRSHALSRTHLHNIIPEIDHLQTSARALGAVAASGFGAGFGGSAYAIVREEDVLDFVRNWRKSYLQRFSEHQQACQFLPVTLSGGATELFA